MHILTPLMQNLCDQIITDYENYKKEAGGWFGTKESRVKLTIVEGYYDRALNCLKNNDIKYQKTLLVLIIKCHEYYTNLRNNNVIYLGSKEYTTYSFPYFKLATAVINSKEIKIPYDYYSKIQIVDGVPFCLLDEEAGDTDL